LGPWLALARALLTKALALEAAVDAASAAALLLLLVPACRDDQPHGVIMTIKTQHCAAAIQLFKRARHNHWPLILCSLTMSLQTTRSTRSSFGFAASAKKS